MATTSPDAAYKVSCTVVDEDTVRYGASEFKRTDGSQQTPWAEVVKNARAIREAERLYDPNEKLFHDELKALVGDSCLTEEKKLGAIERLIKRNFVPKWGEAEGRDG